MNVKNQISVIDQISNRNGLIECFKNHVIEKLTIIGYVNMRRTCNEFYAVFCMDEQKTAKVLERRLILQTVLSDARYIQDFEQFSPEEFQKFFGDSFLYKHRSSQIIEAVKNLARTVLAIAELRCNNSTIKYILINMDSCVNTIKRLLENRQLVFEELSRDHNTTVGFEKVEEKFSSLPYLKSTEHYLGGYEVILTKNPETRSIYYKYFRNDECVVQ